MYRIRIREQRLPVVPPVQIKPAGSAGVPLRSLLPVGPGTQLHQDNTRHYNNLYLDS